MKKRILSLALCSLMLLFSVAAWGANPEDALSAQPEDSIYVALRMDNLGDTLRWILSEKNFKILAPALEIDKDFIPLITRTVAQTPAESVALLAGINAEGVPTLQLALAMPAELQPQLKAISEGKATASDLMTLLIGKNTPFEAFFGNVINDSITVTPAGDGIITVNSIAFVAAKDNLLLVSIMPDNLQASLKALDDSKARLNIKRRINAKDYLWLHSDMAIAEKLSAQSGDFNDDVKTAYDEMHKMFVAPLNLELGFIETPEKFTIAGAVNFTECMAKEYVAVAKNQKPVKGGHIRLIGAGTPLLALGTVIDFSGVEKLNSNYREQIVGFMELVASMLGISKDEVVALSEGGISVELSGRAKFEDGYIPGFSIALTGKDGIASTIVENLAKDEEIPFGAASVKDFDKALQVDPAVSPVPVIVGTQGETLAAVVMDKASREAKIGVSPVIEKLLNTDAFSAMYIDFNAIQEFLIEPDNGVANMVKTFDEDSVEILESILAEFRDVELSVPYFAFYSPAIDMFNIDFGHAEIAAEKGVWAKLVNMVDGLSVMMGENDEEELDE